MTGKELTNNTQHWKFNVISIEDQPDGTALITFDIDDEFIVWFKEWQGLQRWSQKRFQKVMSKVFHDHVEQLGSQQLSSEVIKGLADAIDSGKTSLPAKPSKPVADT